MNTINASSRHYRIAVTTIAAVAITVGLLQVSAAVHAQEGTPEPAPSAAAAVQAKTTPSPKVLAAWRGKVLAHLASHKRAVANTGGDATVAFSIDRAGRVLSAQIVKSSGSAALDKEAVALTKRASPVPAPPSDLTGSKLYLKVPIQFAR
jgi:periplasmic protein TonB